VARLVGITALKILTSTSRGKKNFKFFALYCYIWQLLWQFISCQVPEFMRQSGVFTGVCYPELYGKMPRV